MIEDRAGRRLAWNDRAQVIASTSSPQADGFASRVYAASRGIGHVLGYVKPPAKDSSGFYYRDSYVGVDGAEKAFDGLLRGENGLTLAETDARGTLVSSSAVRPPQAGSKLTLSIDAKGSEGLYEPGSIVKPLMAAAAIAEGVIDEYKQILSTGKLVVPNPYNPDQPTVFKDWRVNGWTDARRAIAVSSDVYFYQVGGGFEDQPGLGIARIDSYLKMFGFGSDAGLQGFSEAGGTIPTPEWKAAAFSHHPAGRLGNTYPTAIGQYGVQVTPLQAVRTAAAIANGGTLLTPSLIASTSPRGTTLAIDAHALQVSREVMRLGVTSGIATAINVPFVHAAAKTGTAQVGLRNESQNAWMVGFWPYENPRYAYAVVLEKMPAGTQIGGSAVMSDFFNFLEANAPEYLSAGVAGLR